MKKRLIFTALLITVLTSILAVSAYASTTYSYTENISAGSPVTTLLTENNTNTKTWTLYPNITLNDSGVLSVSGTGVSVTHSNCSSYAGYFYQDGDGKAYQFNNCVYTTPSSGTKVTGGSINIGSEKNGIVSNEYVTGFYSNVKVVNGELVCYNPTSVVAGAYIWVNLYGSHVYQYNGQTWSHSMGASGWYGYVVTSAGNDTYAWNFRAVPTYTVTFDPQSGSVSPATSTVIYNRTYGTLPTPTRPGYTFNGWFTGTGGTGTRILGTSTVSINSNTTLYASWTVNTYTVTFDPQSGSVAPTGMLATYGSTYGTLPTPTRTGYTFNGWYTGTGGSGTQILSTSTVSITSNTMLYASWKANTYTVTFDPQEGTVSTTSMSVTFDSPFGTLPTPTRTGYNFNGWYTELNGGGTQILSSSTVNITSDKTLYASWSIIQYTVNFESNGGSAVTPITQDYNTSVSKPADPSRIGYTFSGWFTDMELTNAASWPILLDTSDVTIYAAWTINQYTVSFDSNGGGAIASKKQDYNTTITKPTDPTKTGHTFSGWFTDSELKTAVTWPYTIGGSDATLYAAWTINQYTVSFDCNGGSSVASITQDYSSTVIKPTDPKMSGYSFDGWYEDSELKTAVTWPITIGVSDITLYAAWSINQYSVNFDSKGGSSVAAVTQEYNSTVNEPAKPTRSGHTFAGWFTDSELTNVASWPISLGASDITLYAAWTVNPYTMSFESNGGSAVASITQNYGTSVAEPEKPTRSNYTFVGWYSDIDLKNAVSWPMTVGAGDATLYAAWTANPHTVSFESNGGSSVTSIVRGYGSKVTEPDKPTRSGYTFAGWFTDSELKNAAKWPLNIEADDIMLYAAWTLNQSSGPGITPVPNYTVSFDTNDGSTVISHTVLSGDKLEEPAAPSKPGYNFEGWYKDCACTIPWDFSETVTGNVTLYAKWTADIANSKYTVTFVSNGVSIGEQTVGHGKTVVMPLEPTRKGYEFAGWFKNESLTSPWIFFKDVVTDSITLYAKWVLESNIKKPDNFPNGKTPVVKTSSVDKDDEELDPKPNNERNQELEIIGGNEQEERRVPEAPETEASADTYALKDILLISGAAIIAILILILCVCLVFAGIKSIGRKKVYFYEHNSLISSANIRRGKVDITKAVSKASGRMLKVKINDGYIEKAYGNDINFYFNGKPIGTMTIDGDNSFEIAIN